MKKIAIAALFVLGFVELLFPIGMGLVLYAYEPQFGIAFRGTKLTDQQLELFHRFHNDINGRCQTVFYFGIATIAIGILLLFSERRSKRVPAVMLHQPTGEGKDA